MRGGRSTHKRRLKTVQAETVRKQNQFTFDAEENPRAVERAKKNQLLETAIPSGSKVRSAFSKDKP